MKNLIDTLKTLISLGILISVWYIIANDVLISGELLGLILNIIIRVGGLVLVVLFLTGKIKLNQYPFL
jgi:hypothetical protein